MGAKHCKTTNRDNQFIQKVMKKRREGVESKQLANENTFDDVQTRHEISKLLRSEVVTRKGVNQEVCNVVARTITKLTKKELFSTISYFQWEQQLINSLQDDTNQEFVLQVESQRISYLLFSDFPNNFFVRLMHSFEAAVAIKYESVVRLTMTECCEKFRIMSYKKVPMPQMIALMKKLCYKDLTKMESAEHLATVKQAFTEIVTMMKYMGVFFTKLLIFIYTGKTKGNFRSDYHTLSLIMNTMLVPDYIYERYASFFAKVILTYYCNFRDSILHEDMQKWFDNRKILIKQKRAFTDLIYLNQFIIEEDKKRLIRKNTHATMSFSHIGGAKELGAHINSKTMDINEFLAHLEVQVDLDLDEIFTKNLQSILEYFRGIDKFIDMTFKNTELEIKIDLMRPTLHTPV